VGGDRPACAMKIGSELCPGHTEGIRKVVRWKNGWHAALALVHAVMRNSLSVVVGHAFDVVVHSEHRLGGQRSCFGSFDVSEQGKGQGHEADKHAQLAMPGPSLLRDAAQGVHAHAQVDFPLLYYASTGTTGHGP